MLTRRFDNKLMPCPQDFLIHITLSVHRLTDPFVISSGSGNPNQVLIRYLYIDFHNGGNRFGNLLGIIFDI